MKRSLVAATIAALLLLPAAAHAGFAGHMLAVNDAGFTPLDSQGDAGDDWGWINNGSVAHNATSYETAFATSDMAPAGGDSAPPIVLNTPGRFEYRCTIHPDLRATVSVAPGDLTESYVSIDARPGFDNQSTAAFTQGGSAVQISPGLNVFNDPDGDDVVSTRARIANGFQSGDTLSLDLAGATAVYDSGTGVLTITATGGGSAPEGNVQAALRNVKFSTSAGTGTRRVEFDATDDAGTGGQTLGAPDFRNVVVSAPASNNNTNPTNPGGGGAGAGAQQPAAQQPPATLPPPFPRVAPAPVLRLRRSTFTMDAKGRVTLVFTTDPNLRGTVELTPATTARAAQRRRTPFGRASFRANARGNVSVRVRLSTAARRTLRRSKTRRVRATLVIRSGSRTASRAVTLRR